MQELQTLASAAVRFVDGGLMEVRVHGFQA